MSGGIRAAIIGFGGMGHRHFMAYQENKIEVDAICDFYPDKAAERVPGFPREKIYASADELIKRGPYDIVSVVTNSPTHAEITVKCAAAGNKKIFCEKAMATSLVDAQKMIDACGEHGALLAIHHERHWSPNHRKLKKLLDDGLIGKIRHFYMNSGSVGLGNNGVHFFDNMRFYAGSEFDWVMGFIDKTGTPNVRGPQFKDPAGYGVLHFKNGIRAFYDSSEDMGIRPQFEIVGEYGRVIIEEWGDDWRIYARSEEERKEPYTKYLLPMPQVPFEIEMKWDIPGLAARAIREIVTEGKTSCTGHDGMKALEVALAFHISDEKGNAKIKLPLSGNDLKKDVPFA